MVSLTKLERMIVEMSREILWKPPKERSKNAALAKYMDWVKQHYSNDFSLIKISGIGVSMS